ncbi:MAG: DNA alkylation repair protein [Flavobacteriaceae bacterium]|nr:DNA alkylation repair protein [Flavobacteriaceae bacterium]
MVEKEILNRKGARKTQDIPKEVISLLNSGEIETVNLTEWLAINQIELINNTFPTIELSEYIDKLKESIAQLKKPSTMNSIKLVGEILYGICSKNKTLNSTIDKLSNHKSDTLRCYATYLISLNKKLSIEEKLTQSQNLIADTHFGVREIVWMALRPEIEKELKKSIRILSNWTKNSNENIRRFTTEVTRPRGVWCKHIESLKSNPEQALPILESLKSDKSKYVQNSVGNWLNDASKSKPKFVEKICTKWKSDSFTKETEKIIKRARRTIDKK